MQIKEANDNSKYLGLPNILGRNKSVVFGYLRDKVTANIQGWMEKNVSRSVKEILIKMVAQTLPSYAMSVFLLPLELTRDMEKAMAQFFWKSTQKNNSKITWMAWERMSKHKQAGGLGFKSLRYVNLAMLGKQCWRLITNPDSLVARVYKAKYYADSDFMSDKLGSSPSFIWRSILEARKVISAGSSWRIGMGNKIRILDQPWLNDMSSPYISTISPSIINQNIASLFRSCTKE
ncbi:putative mitochondrial protein AtMg00310 [Apium graveolens]|uniref:putative mitochondrial protein AtMg00310 n=1 Tax=Apium graveolens TaxID=4045 RepID=UPI003D7BDC72